MRKTIVAMILGMMVCGIAQAGALKKADVGADAKWLFHFDWEKYNTSEMHELISANPAHAEAQAAIASATEMLGFNPAKDITGITAYGTDYKHGEGTVIIKGNLAAEKAVALLEQNDTHEVEAYGAHSIHTCTAEGSKKGACSFYGEGTVILSRSAAKVKASIDVLDASAASLESSSDGIAVPEMSPDAFIMAYADKVKGTIGQDPRAQTFRNVDSITLAAGETDGNLIAEAQLDAGTAEKAELIHSAMAGMLSFAMLSSADDPASAEILTALKINTDGQHVKISLNKNSKALFEFIMKQKALHQKRLSGLGQLKVPATK